MRELCVAKLPEYTEEDVCVSEWSTVRVKHCAYSVPRTDAGAAARTSCAASNPVRASVRASGRLLDVRHGLTRS